MHFKQHWLKTAVCLAATCLPSQLRAADSLREAPAILRAQDARIGRLIPDLSFADITGHSGKFSDYKSSRALVIAFSSTTCPVSQRYAPTLVQLEKDYTPKSVAFLFVNPIETRADTDLTIRVKAQGFGGPCIPDIDQKISTALGATSTTEVFVLDGARTLIYRGAVDDQYGLGYSLDAPRRRYLAAALDSMLAGQDAEVSATTAPGCALELRKSSTPSPALTYHNRISRILQNNCVECHRGGGTAPFGLEAFEEVQSHAAMMRKQVERGAMPPWFAAPAEHGQSSPWVNDRSLSAEDKADLLAWLSGEQIVGDPRDAPLPRKFPALWRIAEPDAIVEIPKAVEVKATGKMPYQNLFVKTEFGQDRWVQAWEVLPTAREVVHHVLVFVIPKEQAGNEEELQRNARRGEGGGYFAAYVPGFSSLKYADGFAKQIPEGATLHFQIHYTPKGEAATDRTRLALKFAKQPPEHVVRVAAIANGRLRIPAGEANHQENAVLPVMFDAQLLSFLPHMHLRGKAFRFDLVKPDGDRSTLLEVPRYDFNWQLNYRLTKPLLAPRGSRIETTAWYDNSENNPANPDPSRVVTWGPQTDDEMMLGYVEFFVPGAGLNDPSPIMRRGGSEFSLEFIFTQLDKDKNGKLTRDEIPERWRDRVLRLDANADGEVSKEEVGRFSQQGGAAEGRSP